MTLDPTARCPGAVGRHLLFWSKMSWMSVPKKHHYVPQFYLKFFERKQRHGEMGFIAYDKRHGSKPTKSKVSSSVCWEKYFHSIVDEAGNTDHKLVEGMFSTIENDVGPRLNNWLTQLAQDPEWEPEHDDYHEVIAFVAIQFMRTRKQIRNTREMFEEFRAAWTLGRMQSIPEELSKEDRARFVEARSAVENGGIKFTIKQAYKNQIPMGTNLGLSREIYEALIAKNRIFLQPVGTDLFITGDHPVVVFTPHPAGVGLGEGPGSRNTCVWYPLSPEQGLLLYPSGFHPRNYWQTPEDFENELNRQIAIAAEQTIISAYENSRVERWSSHYSNLRSTPYPDRSAMLKLIEAENGH